MQQVRAAERLILSIGLPGFLALGGCSSSSSDPENRADGGTSQAGAAPAGADGAGLGGSTGSGGDVGSQAGFAGALSSGGVSGQAGGADAGVGGRNDSGGSAGGAGEASPMTAGAAGCGTELPTLIVAVDRSTSMLEELLPNRTLWASASEGFGAFVSDAASSGLRVGLRFFPHDLPVTGCSGNETSGCDVGACAELLVEPAALLRESAPDDPQEAALRAAFEASAPEPIIGMDGEGSPIWAALRGALERAAEDRLGRPDAVVAVILMAGGEPNGCFEDIEIIAESAAEAHTGSGVRTYVVALPGSSPESMHRIADAGGTERAYVIDTSETASDEVAAAFAAVHRDARTCLSP